MPNLKASELRKLKPDELHGRLAELRAELSKLKSSSARGTLKKESGEIRRARRNIARILTVINEATRQAAARS